MNELSVHIITQSKDLPIVEGNDLFHSRERFLLIEQTAGTWPYMVVVTDEEGRVKAHLLAELRRRGSLLPPYLFTFARVIGAGVYAPGVDKGALFDRMMGALTRFLHRKLCLYIEVSDLEKRCSATVRCAITAIFPSAGCRYTTLCIAEHLVSDYLTALPTTSCVASGQG